MIRVLIVDDHQVVPEGLRQLLRQGPELSHGDYATSLRRSHGHWSKRGSVSGTRRRCIVREQHFWHAKK
jgi:hypothetical protein